MAGHGRFQLFIHLFYHLYNALKDLIHSAYSIHGEVFMHLIIIICNRDGLPVIYIDPVVDGFGIIVGTPGLFSPLD